MVEVRPSVLGAMGGDTGCGRPTSFSVACTMHAVQWSPVYFIDDPLPAINNVLIEDLSLCWYNKTLKTLLRLCLFRRLELLLL